ncbi:MAG TPA: ATP-binding cassette domain-containing protein, partial [Sphingomicrobium sp.]|nr:ATP-binding cassette domain-containing protein [Sphingomicrobium sp.]
LVRTPKVLLLDEPGVGVDPISRRELWKMVSDLKREGIGVLWSTAYLDEAAICDCVYLLNKGKLLFSGSPADLTGKVEGRVYRVSDTRDAPRRLLGKALDRPEIMDGVIQGRSIRILLKPDANLRSATQFAGAGATIKPIEPRFEEGFVDILGGSIGGSSALAERYRMIPEHEGPVIEAKGLTKRFGDFTATENIRFDVGRGRIFGLLGPNGAGKSTTFKMLCGLLTPSEGTGSVGGYDLRRSRADARGALGYMAQKFSLYGDLSVRQNLDFFAGAYGLDRGTARRAIEAVVDIFDLTKRLETNAGALPLGFKQRLALACAVLHEPPVLFLDEPTSGVDPVMRREFWSHINGLVGKGVTVLVTTHFMDEAEYCDEVTLIYRAAQIATGTPDALKKRAAALSNKTGPSMEDAFVTLIEEHDRTTKRQEAA